MFFGTGIQELLTGPRPKPGRGSPLGLGLLVFSILMVVTTGLVVQSLDGVSLQAAAALSLPVALACGAAGYRLAKRIRAREAEAAYEMQRNRAAETEKQITEMKRKAAKAEGTE